ncbi:cysteine-rich KTR domain-containing protein [uncultured Dysosmobacter sp.]|uniref:cysteine-rich KTR domain-containing protein n=1 Tax=uncultured Dysosmobacter sp. TaxID=2591384 RepID=UPI0026038590|nr:cysteine-rich KTR domain-containing protein [uncultured Dysosmobacter sp.]
MNRKAVVICKLTPSGVFVPCPVCRHGKMLRLQPDTSAAGLVIYCRHCKRESVVDIRAGESLDRVTLRKIS